MMPESEFSDQAKVLTHEQLNRYFTSGLSVQEFLNLPYEEQITGRILHLHAEHRRKLKQKYQKRYV